MRRVTMSALSATLVAVLALTGCSNGTTVEIDVPAQASGSLPDDTVQQLQDAVTEAMAATGASGAIVGVWAPWSGSWVSGLGTTTVGGSTEVDPDMTFRAGRITRAMTCDVLYSLDADGVLDVDAAVTDYVSSVPNLSDVSLRELCDSTSGVGSYTAQLQPLWLGNPDRVWNPRELAAYGLAESSRLGEGTNYRDSDAGYLLLGLALERASGMSAAELYEKYITEPLALDATSLPGSKAAAPGDGPVLTGTVSRRVDGKYNCAEPEDITEISASIAYTDAGIVSDIEDLGRYTQALAARTLMPADTDRYDDPKAPGSKSSEWNKRAGGAALVGSLVGQLGAVPGYASASFADPTTGLTVSVVLNNSAAGGSMAGYLAWELAALASKAPAAGGATAPEAGLPWTAEQFAKIIDDNAICAPAE